MSEAPRESATPLEAARWAAVPLEAIDPDQGAGWDFDQSRPAEEGWEIC